MTPTIRPPTTSRTSDPSLLGLSHILPDLLPRNVHTADGPERYTVSAVFTRRPSEGETDAINGAEARDWLTREQFPDVAVSVSDRRLEIANTNLDELAAGLAGSLARLLAQISTADIARAHDVSDELTDLEHGEEHRWAEIRSLADHIDLNAPARSGQADVLGLSRIATDALPSSLGTVLAPARYTVVAEFTRPLTHTESGLIAGPGPRRLLDAAGYTGASVELRDRRLEIHGTTLEELRDGLANVVAATLADIGRTAAAQDAAAVAEADRLAEQERERAQFVRAAADAITFELPDPAPATVPAR